MTKQVQSGNYTITATGTGGTYNSWEPDGISSGSERTITGSGFGTGNVGFIWSDDTNYDLPDNTEVPLTKYSANGSPWSNKFYTDQNVTIGDRIGSMKGLEKCKLDPIPVSSDGGYYTWYQRFDCDLDDPTYFTTNARSDKFFRSWDDLGGTETRLSWTKMHFTYSDASGVSWPDTGSTANQWQRMEVWLDGGSNIQALVDGVLIHNITDNVDQDPLIDNSWVLVGYDMSNTDHILQTFNVWLGELYALSSRARVEVSTSSTWSGGQIPRYVQEVTGWSDTQIDYNLFTGDFDPEATLYAYVVKEDGTVVAGGIV